MSALAGNGTPGFSGDGALPNSAQLNNPRGLATNNGVVWTADAGNNRVRRVTSVTTTIAPTNNNQRPPQQAPIGIDPPKLGVSIVAQPIAGTVLIRLPGTKAFVPFTTGNFPLGSEFDTTHGTVGIWFETNEDGTQAGVYASQGRFLTKQPQQRDQGQRPGELDLSGPIAKCPSGGSLPSTPGKVVPRTLARGRSAGVRPQLFARAVAAKRKPHGRDVRVRAKGKVKTRGRYGSAIVRGTGWTTHDFCRGSKSGTLFSVFEGVVSVRDFVRHKTVTVAAGRKYFAGS
jgi:hypothetical protein